MLALRGAKVWTMGPKGLLDGATVLVDGGKIRDIGSLDIPSEARVIDVHGLTIVPGFVDAHSHLGLSPQGLGIDDGTETTDQITPQLKALDALDPVSKSLGISLEGGVTTSAMLPGSGLSFGPLTEQITVMPGMASVLKIKRFYPIVMREKAGIKMAFGEQPKRAVAEKKAAPVTRMLITAMVRENLRAAQAYMKKKASGAADFDPKKEALAGLLTREYPALVHVHRVRDIHLALDIKREFGIDLVLHHVTEGHLMAEEIAKQGVPCAVGPIAYTRRGFELANLTLAGPGILARAGVKVALVSDFPTFPPHYLPIHAGMAYREGMPYEEALRSITINAASMLGVADRVGSLEPGKDADFVVFDGDPLGTLSKVKMVFSDGEIVFDDAACSGKGCCR